MDNKCGGISLISGATSPRTDIVDTTKLWQQFSVGI